MTRVYLSPTASTFARIGLVIVECLIGLYNIVSFPIRKITLKLYGLLMLAFAGVYAVAFRADLMNNLMPFVVAACLFTVSILLAQLVHYCLNEKVAPRVAYLINSPMGIPTNRFYYTGC